MAVLRSEGLWRKCTRNSARRNHLSCIWLLRYLRKLSMSMFIRPSVMLPCCIWSAYANTWQKNYGEHWMLAASPFSRKVLRSTRTKNARSPPPNDRAAETNYKKASQKHDSYKSIDTSWIARTISGAAFTAVANKFAIGFITIATNNSNPNDSVTECWQWW